MSAIALGMALRFIQSIFEGAPTLLIGVIVAGVFSHMLGADGTRRLFGNNTWLSLPQSWLFGMLLPVVLGRKPRLSPKRQTREVTLSN